MEIFMSLLRKRKLRLAQILYVAGNFRLYITSNVMLYKNPFKSFQHRILAAAIFTGLTSLTYAADARIESKEPNTQPESNQPQQQAAPAQPTVEPLDDDADTFLV